VAQSSLNSETWFRVSRLLFVLFVLLPGCGKQTTEDPGQFGVEDWLNVCSPFYSVDGEKELTFQKVTCTVILHKVDRIRDPQAKGILETKKGNQRAKNMG
jgi:hypothetical protein